MVVVKGSLQRNTGKLRLSPGAGAPEAVAALFAKGWKTSQALKALALRGYGEDAMGLLRSLVNLTIDLAYIAKEDSENRVRQWAAHAQVQRARLAAEAGITLPERESPDDQVLAAAKRWDGPKIKGRADAAGIQSFYATMYRLGSPFEHSDAWAVSSYLRETADGVVLNVEPSANLTCPPLAGALLCLGVMFEALGKLFAFDFGDDIVKLKKLLDTLPEADNAH